MKKLSSLKSWLVSASVAAVLAICGCYSAKSAESPPRFYTNPVYEGSMPDPSVIRVKDFYYAFGSTDNTRTPDGRIFTVLRSRDLVEWETLGGALTPPSKNVSFHYWAPEATFQDGTFYLYYSMGGLRVGTSQKPEGPYVDAGVLFMNSDTNRFAIDAFPFRDDDGRWYFFYSCNITNAEPGVHPGTGIVVDKLVNMTRLAGDCHVVARARYDSTLHELNRLIDVHNSSFDWMTVEAPCVLKHDGRYYCFYSGSNYRTISYGVDYVVADKPLGPYGPQGDRPRVLASGRGKVRGAGHHSIVTGPDGKTQYIVYHASDPTMTVRRMCVDKLVWTLQGPRCEGPTSGPQPVPGTGTE